MLVKRGCAHIDACNRLLEWGVKTLFVDMCRNRRTCLRPSLRQCSTPSTGMQCPVWEWLFMSCKCSRRKSCVNQQGEVWLNWPSLLLPLLPQWEGQDHHTNPEGQDGLELRLSLCFVCRYEKNDCTISLFSYWYCSTNKQVESLNSWIFAVFELFTHQTRQITLWDDQDSSQQTKIMLRTFFQRHRDGAVKENIQSQMSTRQKQDKTPFIMQWIIFK